LGAPSWTTCGHIFRYRTGRSRTCLRAFCSRSGRYRCVKSLLWHLGKNFELLMDL
jgi:hypothetical protein